MLQYLDFDYSEDAHELGTFDALASLPPKQPARMAAVQAEAESVLAWAHAAFPGRRGPIEQGGSWDYDLQCQGVHAAEQWLYNDDSGWQLNPAASAPPCAEGDVDAAWPTLSFSICGDAAFCAALRQQFALD